MDNYEKTSSGGIGFTGALQIVFIILKLLGKIKWSWIVDKIKNEIEAGNAESEET